MKAIMEEEAPGVFVCTSHEILPEVFEHERFSTTIINACLAPVVSRYLANLTDRLRDGEYKGDVLVLHSGGGVMTAEAISRNAARIAVSGPAAGAMAGAFFARQCGFDNAISLDMGGTSADISLMYGGEVRVANEWSVEFGYPIMFPSIEIVTIGAGGGSVAWIDAGGSLRNGPQSMGADPGPAAYQRGGEEATNTDANLVLGRLSPAGLLGGAMPLDRDAAERAVTEKVAAAARLRRRARRRRHHPGGQREHGRCRPPHLDPPRLRPARFLPRRLRRRGIGPRRPPGPRARHPGGRRSALPGDHLGARLPPPRRAARSLPHLPDHGRQGEQRRAGSRVRQAGRRGAGAPGRRGDRGRPRAAASTDGHALRRSVALADRSRLDPAGGESRRQPGTLPRRARARVRLLRPRPGGGDLRVARRRSRTRRQAGVSQAGQGGGARCGAHRRAPGLLRRGRRLSRHRDLRPLGAAGRGALRWPGDRRADGFDGRRAAGLAGRGRRLWQYRLAADARNRLWPI